MSQTYIFLLKYVKRVLITSILDYNLCSNTAILINIQKNYLEQNRVNLWMTHIPAMKMNSPTTTAMQSIRKAVKPVDRQTNRRTNAIYQLYSWYMIYLLSLAEQ